jgi:lipid II:glycine glycyltransferase (peptidoglycan interpeptide bridge formation enzyme)
MYRLYRQTVERHDGSLRYNQSYFCSLISLSQKSSLLRCLLAIAEDKIIAFLIVGINHDVAFYLHGSVDYKYQSLRPYDLLFVKAIEWAKENKCNKYNMMDSPNDQPSLVRYKEKWGGVTETKTYHYINVNWFMGFVFSKLATLYDYSRRILKKL